MERRVEAEWLDALPVEDAGAAGSRNDLKRLNALMGHARIVTRQLRRLFPRQAPRQLVELGAGDGSFMLGVARELSGAWPGTRILLVDRMPAADGELHAQFEKLRWPAQMVRADVLQLVQEPDDEPWGATVANLFLHHLSPDQLLLLFEALSRKTEALVAVEPRRSAFALAASRLVGAIGCNHVTRHDAPVSVRAGFRGRELSALWPDNGDWRLVEHRAGLFSHLFAARRKSAA